jgi:hypothetical protein
MRTLAPCGGAIKEPLALNRHFAGPCSAGTSVVNSGSLNWVIRVGWPIPEKGPLYAHLRKDEEWAAAGGRLAGGAKRR